MKKTPVIAIIVIVLSGIIALLPMVFTLTGSFMSREEITRRYTAEVTEENETEDKSGKVHFVNVSLIPDKFTAEQYLNLILEEHINFRYMLNSVILVAPILLGQFIIAPMAAFAFEYMSFKYKEVLFFVYIVIMLMPMQLLLVPNFIVAGWLNIRDSYLGIILPAMFHPMGVFLIRQQIKGFPKEAMEAARLDGASEWQVFRRIVRPNMSSAVAALMVLIFADNWNLVDQAIIFIDEQEKMPMSVMLNFIADSNPQLFFSISCIYVLPAIIVFLWGKKHLVEGMSLASMRN